MHLRVIKEENIFSVYRFSGQLKFRAQFISLFDLILKSHQQSFS